MNEISDTSIKILISYSMYMKGAVFKKYKISYTLIPGRQQYKLTKYQKINQIDKSKEILHPLAKTRMFCAPSHNYFENICEWIS